MNRTPKTATIALVLVNAALLGLCVHLSGQGAFGARLIYDLGGISNDTLLRQDYWRLIASAFLHFDVVHILANMMCLLLWGASIEQRVGSAYFLLIYLASAIGGGIVSVLGHQQPFVGAGASGAVSGLLGALLFFAVLRRLPISMEYIASNIALNVLFSVALPQVDWRAHLGGFATGFIVCAVLDRTELLNRRWLRCKFPEFVKINLAVALAALGWVVWRYAAASKLQQGNLALFAGAAVIVILVVKLFDWTLSQKKGLAAAVLALTVCNFALPLLLRVPLESAINTQCWAINPQVRRSLMPWAQVTVASVCNNPNVTITVLAMLAALLTLVILSHPLLRGLKDVGFVAATLIGERKRTTGI